MKFRRSISFPLTLLLPRSKGILLFPESLAHKPSGVSMLANQLIVVIVRRKPSKLIRNFRNRIRLARKLGAISHISIQMKDKLKEWMSYLNPWPQITALIHQQRLGRISRAVNLHSLDMVYGTTLALYLFDRKIQASIYKLLR